jgi:hypothetical protein
MPPSDLLPLLLLVELLVLVALDDELELDVVPDPPPPVLPPSLEHAAKYEERSRKGAAMKSEVRRRMRSA